MADIVDIAVQNAWIDFEKRFRPRIEDRILAQNNKWYDRDTVFLNLDRLFKRWMRIYFGIRVIRKAVDFDEWVYMSYRNDDDLTMLVLQYG